MVCKMTLYRRFGLCIVVFLLIALSSAHAGMINSTTAEGFAVYGELNTAAPRYRIFNDTTRNFTAEANALSLGTAGTDDPQWVVARANHERDELVVGTLDSSNDINVQILNSTKQWENMLELATDAPNAAHRAFDIAVEDVSGDVLVVYENSSAANNVVSYIIWNGTGYSDSYPLVTGIDSSAVSWVSLTSKTGTDDIMLLVHNSQADGSGDLHAVPWNGTGFDFTKNITLSDGTASGTTQHFTFAWEETSGAGIAIYGENDLTYRTYSPTAPHWSTEATVATGGLNAVRLCSDPASDSIGIIWQDTGNDVNVRMWDGTQLLGSPPAEDAQTEPSGANSANVDCTWFNSNTALFGFVDFNSLNVDYFNFTKPNTWSTAGLITTQATAGFASDDIAGFRFAKHPVIEQIFITAADIAEDISMVRWFGSAFGGIGESPIETSTEALNGDQEGVSFAWSQYDPVPNVTAITPSENNFGRNALVPVNITAFDNINVSTVLANVTLPNGSMITYYLNNITGSVYNFTFNLTGISGIYTIHALVNDTSVHHNLNASLTSTFTVGDFRAPNVTNLTTTYDVSFPVNMVVNITVNVTDDVLVSMVLVNVTVPNGSVFQLPMINDTGSSKLYNASFTHTGTTGYYTYVVIANDTSTNLNNVNSTETGMFAIGDVLAPHVTDIVPLAGANFNPNTAVNISVNVSDNSFVSVVLANITLPNGTVRQITLGNGSSQRFNASFIVTDLAGSYSVRIIANDTGNNNINSSEFSTFTVGNHIAPLITLTSPPVFFNSSLNSVGFVFTATDDNDLTINCSILINATSNATNTSIVSGQSTILNITGFKDADYNWSVACNDSTPNANISAQSVFTVDTAAPQFNSLVTFPSGDADLDPNSNITVLADITDNTTSVQAVVLQYKLSNESDDMYVNASMILWGSGLFNISFNATRSGTYHLRLFANDSAGNKDISNIVPVAVALDRSWTVNPTTFPIAISSLALNVSVGNLTINNTGDVHLYFNITSSSNLTAYNVSENFTLLPGELKHIRINDNSSTGVKIIVLNVSVNDTSAEPRSQSATGTIVVAQGQPILSSVFSTPVSENINATLGGAVEFVNLLQNLGEGNATNVSVSFTIPQNWTVTFGSLTTSLADFASGDSAQQTLRVFLPATLQAGVFDVYVNVTGLNSSGSNLTDLNLTFGDRVRVTVSAQQSLGSSSSSGGGGGSGNSAPASAAASGGGGGGVSFKAAGGASNTIQTVEQIRVARGSGETVPLTITNLYQHAFMQNIHIKISGFLASYVVVSPPIDYGAFVDRELRESESNTFTLSRAGEHTVTVQHVWGNGTQIMMASTPQTVFVTADKVRYVDLDGDGWGDAAVDLLETKGTRALLRIYELYDVSQLSLAYGEQLDYSLDVAAPEYLVASDYNLSVRIDAELRPVNATAAGFTKRLITEFRTLLFRVGSLGTSDVEARLHDARTAVQEMMDAGFAVSSAQELLDRAEEAFGRSDYEATIHFADQAIALRDSAFTAQELIIDVQSRMDSAEARWLDTPQTHAALELALLSFERGDFVQAMERAKTAQLQYVLETKGRVNILWFLGAYWWAIIGVTLVLTVAGLLCYSKLIVHILEQRLRNLDKEESTIHKLIRETQKKYFDEKSMSAGQYKRALDYYNNRLTFIKQLRVRLRSKKNALLSTQHKLDALRKEKDSLLQLLKENQFDYLVRKKIGRDHFQRIHNNYTTRLADIEHDEAVLEERLRVDGAFGDSRALQFVHLCVHYLKQMLQHVRRKLPAQIMGTYGVRVEKKIDHSRYDPFKRSPPNPQETARPVQRVKDHWVQVNTPHHVQHAVNVEKYGLKLPVHKDERSQSFENLGSEAFDQELLRMAQHAQRQERESGKELTIVELAEHKKKADARKLQRQMNSGLDPELMKLADWKGDEQ